MTVQFGSSVLNVVAVVIALTVVIYTYFKWSFTYWKSRNIPDLDPSFPFGDMSKYYTKKLSIGSSLKEHYDRLKSLGHKHGGIFNIATPNYVVIDPEYIKNILQSNFDYFVDRGLFYNKKHDPVSSNMFFVDGAEWRNIRIKLTPTFTSGKMKMMFETMVKVSDPMEALVRDLAEKNEDVDIKDIAGRFIVDVIGTCAFGIDCNSFKDPNSDFVRSGKTALMVGIKLFLYVSFPNLARMLRGRFFSKKISDFFLNIIKETIKYREKSNVRRNDMLQILLDLKNDTNSLTVEELAAQSLLFFVAGFDTSSTTIAMALFELSRNEDIQNKLRAEIEKTLKKYDEELNYTTLKELKYMNQVIDETLRMYTPLPMLNRKCVKDYKIPNTDIVIEKGVTVSISLSGLHSDPEHHPNPEVFDPDRFSDERKQAIKPFTFMPFGEGPRNCIGYRFGIMQIKISLVKLLRNFKFSLSDRTTLPLEIDTSGMGYLTKSTIWLKASKID